MPRQLRTTALAVTALQLGVAFEGAAEEKGLPA